MAGAWLIFCVLVILGGAFPKSALGTFGLGSKGKDGCLSILVILTVIGVTIACCASSH